MVLVLFAVAGVWPSGFQTLRSKSYYHAGSAFARALGGARGVQGAGPSSILTSVTPRAGTIALPKFASPEGDPRTPRLRTKFLSGHGGGANLYYTFLRPLILQRKAAHFPSFFHRAPPRVAIPVVSRPIWGAAPNGVRSGDSNYLSYPHRV